LTGEKKEKHTWKFTARFRSGAYGWKASALACKRVREAVSEIMRVAVAEPVLAAEGAIKFFERVNPAFMHVDSSSGALGTVIDKAISELAPIIVQAQVPEKKRAKWLDRLWGAYQDDGMCFIEDLGDYWGNLCGSADTANRWADDLRPAVLRRQQDRHATNFGTVTACYSCLLRSGRYQEILEMLAQEPHKFWPEQKFGAMALLEQGKKAEAIKFAEACKVGARNPDPDLDQFCEDILLSSGFHEEAYRKYAFSRNWRYTTRISIFRAISQKYPMKEPGKILSDLIASTPGEEGKWFATAKELGLLDLALDLARRSPCDPKMLTRAARDFKETNPKFALNAAMAAIHWLCHGYGWEITDYDVVMTYNLAMEIAEKNGVAEKAFESIRSMVEQDTSPGMFVKSVLGDRIGPRHSPNHS